MIFKKSASDFKATKFTIETKEEIIKMTALNKVPKLKNKKTNTIWIPLKTESRMIVV